MDKRVFITGAGGFIGQHLCRKLAAKNVSFFASKSDILSPGLIDSELRAFMPNVVVHLAAVSHPRTCAHDPALAREVNVVGTSALLESIACVGSVKRLIFASTAQVYAPQEGVSVRLTEESPIGPINFYAQTKLESEGFLASRVKDLGIEGLVFRIFNHVHKSQSAQTFLSSIYGDMLRVGNLGGQVPVGNLNLRRDIGAISDLLEAFNSAISLPFGASGYFKALNICSGRPRLLSDLAHLLAESVGFSSGFVVDPTRLREGESAVMVGSHDLATTFLGWRPRVGADRELIGSFLGEISYV